MSITDKYKGFISLNSILTGQNIAWFHYKNPYTIDNIRTFIYNNNISCDLLSTEWVSSYDNLIFKCNVCGKEFYMSWNTFCKGKTKCCVECSNRINGVNKRNDIKTVKEEFITRKYSPLFDEYNCNKERLPVKDEYGYLGLMSYHQLCNGSGFDKFHPKNPYTYVNIKHYIQLHNLKCEFISGDYKSNESPLLFKCECGEYFTTSWASFTNLNKTRCYVCSEVKSRLELLTEKWLNENECIYDYQYSIPCCKNKLPLPFDFCIKMKDKIVLIECQGIQHFEPVDHFGGVDGFIYRSKNDNIKRKYCLDNDIKLIEISYKEFNNKKYTNILKEELLL
jgi:hypothetical protein